MFPPRAFAAVALVLATGIAPAMAKFGMSKTKVILPRHRPPEITLLGETVAIEVSSRARAVTERHLETLRGELEAALADAGSFRLVESAEGADNVVRVSIDDLRAHLQDTVEMETRYVKIGERQEWDEKKQKTVTKDVYGNRDEPVTVHVASGHLVGRLEASIPGGIRRSVDIGDTYDQRFRDGQGGREAASEPALEDWLVEQAARRAVAVVAFSPDPVTALLAVDGELKDGNRMAESGRFQEALDEWRRRPLKGNKEAARLHNLGVAHEALAYTFPMHEDAHREHLREAEQSYRKAAALDPGEKYFREPLERITVSLDYAEAASGLMAELAASRAGHVPRPVAASPAGERADGTWTPSPLRNGSFESSLAGWRLEGTGAVVTEGRRGRVLELSGDAAAARAAQTLELSYDAIAPGVLNLEYRVVEGEPPLRLVLRYEDVRGRERTSSTDVSLGESPAGWTRWEMELDRLRPAPARLLELALVVQEGRARFDNVALGTR
ncbi:MAG TPA: hypothetical protein VII13_09775 [Vicinamibacteria bacterium]|jgi:hypothetical protein